MALKPSPRVAVLLQDRVQEALERGGLEYADHMALRKFNQDLERYLN